MSDYNPVRTSLKSERRTVGEDFDPVQRVWLSRGVVSLCLWRLEQILRLCNPLDHPLAHFLKAQIAEEEECADSLKQLDMALHRSIHAMFCSEEYDAHLSGFFPSAFSRSGEGRMDREAALHFVELLEVERHFFFTNILEGLSEDPPGSQLKAESTHSADRLHLVRTILLPPANSLDSTSPPITIDGHSANQRTALS